MRRPLPCKHFLRAKFRITRDLRRCLVAFAEQGRCIARQSLFWLSAAGLEARSHWTDMAFAPERNHVQVVRRKGCNWGISISVDAPTGSVTVLCPICMERRSYIACTEAFLDSPSWKVMRTLQGKRRMAGLDIGGYEQRPDWAEDGTASVGSFLGRTNRGSCRMMMCRDSRAAR